MASRGVNKVIIVGNLGADPEMKYLPSGDSICNIRVATSETWKDKNTGEQKESTEWHSISAFGKLAQIMGEYLRKGSQVYIEGSLRTDKYEKNGETRYSTKIRADQMQMLGGRPGGGGGSAAYDEGGSSSGSSYGGGNAPARASRPAPAQSAPAREESFGNDVFDDDIPF